MNGIPLRPSNDALHQRAMNSLVRACIATAHAKLNPGVSTRSFITAQWGSEGQRDVDMVLKAASAPATTSNAAWAGALSPIVVAFLSNLVPYSAGADLLSRGLKLDFDGAGLINVSNLAMPLGDFVGQGAPIPVVQATTSKASLTPSKLAVITTLSNETLNSSNAEQLVRTALLEAMGPSLDRRLFDANPAVADLRPQGLLYSITPLAPTPSTNGANEAMLTDLKNLIAAVAAKSANGGVSIIASPAQAVAVSMGVFGAAPQVLPSSTLPNGTVVAVANNAIVSAFADPLIDTTRAASVVMDTAPGAIMAGGAVHAAFQTDTTGLRVRWPICWSLRDPAAIAAITATAW